MSSLISVFCTPCRRQRLRYQTHSFSRITFAGTGSRHVSHRLVVWPWKTYGAALRSSGSAGCRNSSVVASPPSNSIGDQSQHQQLEHVERPEHRRIGLEELPPEALNSIDGYQ